MADEMALLIADLYEAAGAVRRSGERIAATQGQTQARWQVLSVLSDLPYTAAQAARRLGVSRQNVQRVVNELVGEGLVELVANPAHSGSPLLRLRPAGRAILARVTRRATVHNRALAQSLGEASLGEARVFLQRLTAALQAEGA